MSAAELDDNPLRGLEPSAGTDSLSVMLGAGASVAAGLPDWDTLATQLLQLSGTIPR